MYPNTFMMQEYVRRYVDEALHGETNAASEPPQLYIVPKGTSRCVQASSEADLTTPGTPIPSNLILINEFMSRFSLQPSRGTPLQGLDGIRHTCEMSSLLRIHTELNQSLGEFFDQFATKKSAEEWLDNHPYPEAMPDEADEIWTSR